MSQERRIRTLSSSVGVAAFLLALGAASPAGAATAAAIAGTVSSPSESAMEGVVVSARRDGDTKTISVVSDDKGRYAFPASKIEPGHYTLRMRATGFDLDGAPVADVVAATSVSGALRAASARSLNVLYGEFAGTMIVCGSTTISAIGE